MFYILPLYLVAVQLAPASTTDINTALNDLEKNVKAMQKVFQNSTSQEIQRRVTESLELVKKQAIKEASGKRLLQIVDVLDGSGGGLSIMVQGIKSKNWLKATSGALILVSSVSLLAGPVGVIVAGSLALISAVIGMFGGAAPSVSRMITETVERALDQDLKADAQGARYEFTAIAYSVQHFRNGRRLTESQMAAIYAKAFHGLSILGKLQYKIAEKCVATKQEDAEKCLGFMEIYSDMSIIRQFVLSDIAALASQGRFNTTAANLLNFIKQERINDGHMFQRLINPFYHRESRYVSAVYFQMPEKWKSIIQYITKLNKESILEFPKAAMFCDGINLQDDCIELSEGYYSELRTNPGKWDNDIDSVYIPLGLKIRGYSDKSYSGSQYGSYYGPLAIGKLNINWFNGWDSIIVWPTSRNALKQVRICRSGWIGGSCVGLKRPSYSSVLHRLNLISGQNWENDVESVSIPNGLKVYAWNSYNKRYGPFVGPMRIENVCGKNEWTEIRIQMTSQSPDDMMWFCESESLGGQCGTMSPGCYNNLNNVNGCDYDNWISSIKLPPGMRVTAWAESDYKGQRFGPYIGPATINKIDGDNTWESLKIDHVDRVNHCST